MSAIDVTPELQGNPLQELAFRQFLKAAREWTFDHIHRLWAEVTDAAAAHRITGQQLDYLSPIFENRFASRAKPAAAPARRAESWVGSRPRTPKSLLRRRHLSRENWIDMLAGDQLTNGEMAVATVILEEIATTGTCELLVGKIAALAGVSRTWVQHTLRILTGRAGRLIDLDGRPIAVLSVEARPWKRRKHKTNLITLHPTQGGLLARLKHRMTWWKGRGAKLRHALKKGQSIVGTTRHSSRNSIPLSRDHMAKRGPPGRDGLSGGESARSGPPRPMRVEPG